MSKEVHQVCSQNSLICGANLQGGASQQTEETIAEAGTNV